MLRSQSSKGSPDTANPLFARILSWEVAIVSSAASPDEKYLATAAYQLESDSDDKVIRLWDWRTGALLGEVEAWTRNTGITFNSNSTIISIAQYDSVHFYSLPSLELVHSLRIREIGSIIWWSDDSRYFATESIGKRHLVEYSSGKVLWKSSERVSFSPDCRYRDALSHILRSFSVGNILTWNPWRKAFLDSELAPLWENAGSVPMSLSFAMRFAGGR